MTAPFFYDVSVIDTSSNIRTRTITVARVVSEAADHRVGCRSHPSLSRLTVRHFMRRTGTA